MMSIKKNIPLLSSGLLTMILFCLLLVAGVVLFSGGSLGWFAEGHAVTAQDMRAQFRDYEINVTYEICYNADTYVEVATWDDVFSGLTPGDTVKLRATYVNQSDTDRTLTFSLAVPNGGEVPLTMVQSDDTTHYYYFGSQLYLSHKSITVSDTQPTEESTDETTSDTPNTFFITPSDNYLYHTAPQTASDISLGDAVLSVGKTVVVEVTIVFVNYTDINQNVYQHFCADGDECSVRYLRADIS